MTESARTRKHRSILDVPVRSPAAIRRWSMLRLRHPRPGCRPNCGQGSSRRLPRRNQGAIPLPRTHSSLCFAFSHRLGKTSSRPRNSVRNRRIFSVPVREAGTAVVIGRQSCGGSIFEDPAVRSAFSRASAWARARSRAANSASAASISATSSFSLGTARASWHQPACTESVIVYTGTDVVWCQEIINGNRTLLLAWHQILAHRNARKHRKLWAISETAENPKSGASTSSAIPAYRDSAKFTPLNKSLLRSCRRPRSYRSR